MHRLAVVGGFSALALLSWGLLGWLVFAADAGSAPALAPRALAAGALLFIAPATTFMPLARLFRAPLYDMEAIAGWASFGFVLTFLAPRQAPSLAEFLIFLLPLTVALASVGTLGAYLIGLRVFRNDPRRYDFVRARRQGYLAALFLVALALLHGIGVLTAANGVLLLVICVLVEALTLARWRAPEQRPVHTRT